MRKILHSLSILAFSASMFLVSSCSEDDKGMNNNNQVTNEQFLQMKALVDTLLIPTTTSFAVSGVTQVDGVDVTDYDSLSLGKLTSAEQDSLFITFHVLTGWWEAFYSTNSGDDPDTVYSLAFRDSVQFKSSMGLNQFAPDESTDYMHNIRRVNASFEAVADNTLLEVDTRNDVTFDNLQSETALIDGPMVTDFHVEFDTLGRRINADVRASVVVEELEVPIPVSLDQDVCPTSGVVTYAVTENLTSQFVADESFNVTWSVQVTIVDAGHYRVKITAGAIVFDEYDLYAAEGEIDCQPASAMSWLRGK